MKIYVFYPDVHLSRIFLLIRANLESQIPLGSLTFPTVENPWRNNLNNYLVIYGGFSILGVPPLASKLSLNFLFLTQSCFKNLLQACYFFHTSIYIIHDNHTTGWINYLNNNACESLIIEHVVT